MPKVSLISKKKIRAQQIHGVEADSLPVGRGEPEARAENSKPASEKIARPTRLSSVCLSVYLCSSSDDPGREARASQDREQHKEICRASWTSIDRMQDIGRWLDKLG